MNRTISKVTFSTMLLLLAGGSIACMYSGSSFFSKFSLNELVERNKTSGGLNCSAGGAGDGIGIGAGGVGKGPSHFHKGESFSCQIGEQFDQGKFIEALKRSVEKDLDASEAKIISSDSPDVTKFYFEYTVAEINGRVEISGTRSGNYYTVKADLDETR